MAPRLPSQRTDHTDRPTRTLVLRGLLALIGTFALLLGPAFSGIASANQPSATRIAFPIGTGQNACVLDLHGITSLRSERTTSDRKRTIAEDGPSAILTRIITFHTPTTVPLADVAMPAITPHMDLAYEARGPPQRL